MRPAPGVQYAGSGPAAEARRMLALRGVALVRAGNRLLSGIDLTVAQGERLLILGPNGAGKTLLMQVAHRLVAPTQGEVAAGPVPGVPEFIVAPAQVQ